MRVTAIYVVSGILLGVLGGVVLGRLSLERYLAPWVRQMSSLSQGQAEGWEKEEASFRQRLPTIVEDAWSVVRRVWIYVLIGIGVGAGMHGFVPEGFFERYMSSENVWAVPLSVLCAVPLYANAAGIVPIVQVLVAKGIPLGTAHRLYDGGGGFVPSGGDPVEKSDDLAPGRYLFWGGESVYRLVRVSVQSSPVRKAGTFYLVSRMRHPKSKLRVCWYLKCVPCANCTSMGR